MRHIANNTRRFYYWLVDLVAPPSCAVCGKVDTWLCEKCAPQILLLDGPICQRCGQRWSGGPLCASCRHSPLQVSPVRSVFEYNDSIRQIIHALKYRGATEIVATLGPQLKQSWQHYKLPSDFLVPVPLHETREKQRGYNQSHIIAQTMNKLLRITTHAILTRTKNTASQTKLNKQERKQNVEAAFTYTADIDIQGKHITLVDDVATTGATLDACANVLLSNGAQSVNAFTLARAS